MGGRRGPVDRALQHLHGPGAGRPLTLGSAAVDFVLVSALLTLLFVAVLQLTLALHVRNTVVDAASEGARFGALTDRGPEDAAGRTRLLIDSALSSAYVADVSAGTVVVDGVQTVVVTVRAPLPVIGLLGPRRLEVDGHAVDEDAL